MFEKSLEKPRRVFPGRSGNMRPAHGRSGKSAFDRVHAVIVQFEILFRRALPVADVWLIPQLPKPGFDFFHAIAVDGMPDPSIDQLGPFFIVLWRIGPAGE